VVCSFLVRFVILRTCSPSRASRSSFPRLGSGLLVCSSVFALGFMTHQEYHHPTSPSLAPFASFDLPSFEAQLRHILSTLSGSARCSESASESRAVTAAGLHSSISVSAVPTMDSTPGPGLAFLVVRSAHNASVRPFMAFVGQHEHAPGTTTHHAPHRGQRSCMI
jgi:hypothetical protein